MRARAKSLLDTADLLSYIVNKLEDVLVAPEELGNLKGKRT
jgi:hypothetical protein